MSHLANADTDLDTVHPFGEVPDFVKKYLKTTGIAMPTPIQAKTSPVAIEGRDILAESPTGSGKTLAFAIPLATRLASKPVGKHPTALVLTPTRELCLQVAKVVEGLLSNTPVKVASIIGGASYQQQRSQLRYANVIVGTPGRVIDLMEQNILNLSHIEIFVLDEVDQMLDIGFADALEKIRAVLPVERQTLLFSATLQPRIRKIAAKLLKDPVNVTVSREKTEKANIEHGYVECRVGGEEKALLNLLLWQKPTQALIFCETKLQCASLTEQLMQRGISAAALNSDMGQKERTLVMSRFKEKRLQYLVATNVAARGIDVQDLPLVVNMNVPFDFESYIHRSGRTGRAGATGKSWTLVTPKNWRGFQQTMRLAKIEAQKIELPASEELWNSFIQSEIEILAEGQLPERTRSIEKRVSKAISEMPDEHLRLALRTAIVKSLQRLSIFDSKEFAPERPLQDGGRKFGRREDGDRKFDRHPGRDRSREGSRERDSNFKEKRPFKKGGKPFSAKPAKGGSGGNKPFKKPSENRFQKPSKSSKS